LPPSAPGSRPFSPAQIRETVSKLSDEQLWWRPNESSNSVGNLILHLSGSINYYLNHNFGGLAFDRDREQEFAERRQIPRQELLATFDGMVANAVKTFDGLTVERLSDPSPEPRQSEIVFQDLLNIAIHVSTHAGQIVWIAKMLTGGGLDDVWMRSPPAKGAPGGGHECASAMDSPHAHRDLRHRRRRRLFSAGGLLRQAKTVTFIATRRHARGPPHSRPARRLHQR